MMARTVSNGEDEGHAAGLETAVSRRDYKAVKGLLKGLTTENAKSRMLALGPIERALEDVGFVFDPQLRSAIERVLDGLHAVQVADAARNRLALVMKGDIDQTESVFLAGLVTAHGSASDVEWLGSFDAGAVVTVLIAKVIACSDREEAHAVVRARFTEGKLPIAAAIEFGQRNRPAGMEMFGEALRGIGRSGAAQGAYSIKGLVQAYASSVLGARLEEAKSVLRGCSGSEQSYELVYGLQVLRENGHDLAGCEALLEAPAEALDRFVGMEEPSRRVGAVYSAMYAIEYNPVCWSSKSATALERAAAAMKEAQPALSADLLSLERRVRAHAMGH